MTREVAVRQLQSLRDHCQSMMRDEYEDGIWVQDIEALDLALSALRPVSREEVEKVWRGEWKPIERLWKYSHQWQCSRCGQPTLTDQKQFCDFCGAPMTGEAVEMVMERLEALYERNDD